MLNVILEAFGFDPVAILADEDYVTYGIIAAGLWPQTAYCMILYLTGLNSVDPELIEAGRIDNARGWRLLWYVILPQLKPATFIAIVVTVVGALRSFDLISIMTRGGPWGSSRVLAYYMYEKAFSEYGYRMGYAAAIAVILLAIMMIYIAVLQAISKEVLEAAKVDGAGPFATAWRIKIPILLPTIRLSVFLSILGSLQLFDIIMPLTGGGPSNVTHSMVTYLYYFGVMRMKFGFGSAVGVVIFLICFTIAIAYQKTLMRND